MSRIDRSKVVRGEAYDNLRRDSDMLHETNDCAVMSLALVTGVPYTTAHSELAKQGRKPRHGTHTYKTHAALKALGFEAVEIDSSFFIHRYPKAHQILRGLTSHHPQRFNKVWADGCHYLMQNHGHIWAVLNGVNHDWSAGRALRIRRIWRVVKAGAPRGEVMSAQEQNSKIRNLKISINSTNHYRTVPMTREQILETSKHYGLSHMSDAALLAALDAVVIEPKPALVLR